MRERVFYPSSRTTIMHNIHKMKRYALIAAVCSLAMGATAQTQNLTKEITVEKDYVPVEHKATKQNALPKVQQNPADMNATLTYSDWAMPANVPAKIPTMTPYGYQTNKQWSTNKGYADLGIGSQLNIVGSAGYRVLDNDSHRLALWLQHCSSFLGKNSSPEVELPNKQKYNDNTIGANHTSQFYEGTLSIDASLNFDNFNYYAVGKAAAPEEGMLGYTGVVNNFSEDEMGMQKWMQFLVSSGWQSRRNDRNYTYGIKGGFGYGGFSKSGIQLPDYDNGAKETSFFINLNAKYFIQDNLKVGADLGFDFASYNTLPSFDFDTWKYNARKHSSLGVASVSPFLRYQRENLLLQLGVNFDIAINSGSTFNVSPNVKADYNFTPGVGIFLDLKGGTLINHLWQMKALNRYINPTMCYKTSDVPLDIEAGFNLGAWQGFSAKIFGGFASYNSYMMPQYTQAAMIPASVYEFTEVDMRSAVFYRGMKLSGWKAGAELGYKYRSLVDAKARFTYSPQNDDEGCILGLDRPEYVIDANIAICPIEPLRVNIGYEMRGNRAIYGTQIQNNGEDYWEAYKLNNVMNLKLGASYRVMPNLTVFVNAENLMNKQWDWFIGHGAQKLNIMGGAGITF